MTLHKPKDLQHTYMNAMLDGTKTVEGRLNDSFWSDVEIGDCIVFYDNAGGREEDYHYGRPQSVRDKYPFHSFIVMNVELFNNFGDMYDIYGRRLLPDVRSRQEAIETYENISLKFSRDNVDRYGCVAVTVEHV